MAHHVELHIAAKTDIGLIRSHNEDAVAISAAHGIAVVADGMGGYNAGEIASGMASVIFKEILEEKIRHVRWDQQGVHKLIRHWVIESVEHANSTIFQSASLEPEYSGMGTTLVGSFFHHDKVIIAHVGDSRAYRLRQGKLEQITRDHSVLQEQIDAGLISEEYARFAPNRNLVTRAVGVAPTLNVETREHVTEAGDMYLLCSDGLTDMLALNELAELMNGVQTDLEAACQMLIDIANKNGGRDNISVVIIRLKSVRTEAAGLAGRIRRWLQR
ncbi:MAG: Stp1/IreP family PP2C-type Ser/Thr phosphatase [Herminiimonas sp.]|nr:Stp1/IreP family PP2C-type Ser/Thr phosphatase [Herminiimonas sp.]